MTKEELLNKLKAFTEFRDKFVCEVFFLLKIDDDEFIKRADIDGEVQDSIKQDFLNNLNEKIITNEELRLVNISQTDERKNIIFSYDLDEQPRGFENIKTLQNEEEFELFSFREDNLRDIHGILFLLHKDDNTLISFKKHYPINLYRRDSRGRGLIKSENRFVEMSDDILRLYPDFDFFYLNDDLFIQNVKVLERFFGFHDVLKNKAFESITLLEESDIVEDLGPVKDRIGDLSFTRKLAQVNLHSRVLTTVNPEKIIQFAKNYPTLKGRFTFNEDGKKFDLKTRKSQNLFMKLLNDDFLKSQLTESFYESSSKDKVELTV